MDMFPRKKSLHETCKKFPQLFVCVYLVHFLSLDLFSLVAVCLIFKKPALIDYCLGANIAAILYNTFFPQYSMMIWKIAEMEMLLWFFFVGHEYNIYVKNHMICQNNASSIRQKKTALEFFFTSCATAKCTCSVKV